MNATENDCRLREKNVLLLNNMPCLEDLRRHVREHSKGIYLHSAYKPWGQHHTEAQHLGVDKQQRRTYDTRVLQSQSHGHCSLLQELNLSS